MRALRVVGLADDGKTVICEDSGRGEQFTLPADERLRAAARGDAARLSQLDSERESQMRPREIQARIRAGESVEQVATAAGMPEQKVERFAYPVLLERSRTAELAQAAHPVREDGPDAQTLNEVLAHAFSQRGQDFAAATWDSWRGEDGKWVVELSWAAGRSDFAAHWVFHPGAHGGTVTAIDEHAVALLDPNPNRTLRTVRPVTELAQQALEVQQPARRVVSAPEPVEERIESPPAARAQPVTPVEPIEPVQPVARQAPPVQQPEPVAVREPAPAPKAAELDFIDDFELATPDAAPVPTSSLEDTELADIELAEPAVMSTSTATPEDTVETAPEQAPPAEPKPAVTSPEPAAAITPEPEPQPVAEAKPEPEPAKPEPEPAPEPAEPAAKATPDPEPAPEPQPAPKPAAKSAPAKSAPARAEPAKPEPAEPAAAATTTEPAAKTESNASKTPAAKAEPAEQQLPMEPAARKAEPTPPARQRKGKKGRPIVPSWEDVLLGTRSNRG